jgi:hypothetical protein
MLDDALVPDAVLLETPTPPVERLAATYPELRRRNLTGALMIRSDSEVGPVKESDLYTVL